MRFDPTTTRTLIATINPDAPSPEAKAPRIRPPRQRNPAMQLLDAVMRLAGPHAELLRHAERPWERGGSGNAAPPATHRGGGDAVAGGLLRGFQGVGVGF